MKHLKTSLKTLHLQKCNNNRGYPSTAKMLSTRWQHQLWKDMKTQKRIRNSHLLRRDRFSMRVITKMGMNVDVFQPHKKFQAIFLSIQHEKDHH